jgi:hypothetical protein
MSINRYNPKVDENQPAIVKMLRERGASVDIIGRPVDLLVGFNGQTAMVEVKNPATRYGRKGENGNQKSFLSEWKGGLYACIHDASGVDTLLGMMK